jgi:hypothetical protein
VNIYLDISGTIITNCGKAAKHVVPFLESLVKNHSPFWLSTLCHGDTLLAHEYLSRFFDAKDMEIIRQIPAAKWEKKKTDGIDFAQDFLWFDDGASEYDEQFLEDNGRKNNLIIVDHNKNPDFFLDFKRFFK